MHILVTNDDGPPSAESSPYVLPFVRHLEAAGHQVSVVLPSEQRSWIAKAHMIGQDVKATLYRPPPYDLPDPPSAQSRSWSSTSSPPSQQWHLVNSTPATCAQIGLHHLLGPPSTPLVDLVISGPNYGRNTTAVFALSSGTLGAALEAAVTGYRAIALSFAFTNRDNDPTHVAAACRQSVRVVEWIHAHGKWDAAPGEGVMAAAPSDEARSRGNAGGVVFSVNVPVRGDVEGRKVRWTRMLQNAWVNSCFAEEAGSGTESPGREEREVREQEVDGGKGGEKEVADASSGLGEEAKVRHFKWSPKFGDVYESVRRAGEGSDGWAVAEGETSVTMLRANFMHVEGGRGELKL